jgi:hypothetical protein
MSDGASQFEKAGYAKIVYIFCASVLIGGISLFVPNTSFSLLLAASSISLGVLSLVLFGLALRRNWIRRCGIAAVAEFIESDAVPSFFVSFDGIVTSSNLAARKMCETRFQTLAEFYFAYATRQKSMVQHMKTSSPARGMCGCLSVRWIPMNGCGV